MASDQILVINSLASRLENATSTERIFALQELQSHARTVPELVGSLSLKPLLDFLKEQGSAEEYQEALDLMYRLVKCRDKAASKANADIVLGDVQTVELLLDLLNHEDLTVGVMTSQILTEIHASNGAALEDQIQQCPDGMNKLLQRLPDSSREEVRNQAIVLVQQLTLSNEEMKKTLVFNEGFEILFGIMQAEGGVADGGLVVQDCLQITCNILTHSETCQRLFYAMGGDWVLRLGDYFDPVVVEALGGQSDALEEDGDERDQVPSSECWFDESHRLSCALLGMAALHSSLTPPSAKHQLVLTASTVVVPAAAFWIARRGPAELVAASLSLLYALVQGSGGGSGGQGVAEVGQLLANTYIKVGPAVPRKNFPRDTEAPLLLFGWCPVPGDDRRCVGLLSLLAESYVYPKQAWSGEERLEVPASLGLRFDVAPRGQGEETPLAAACLRVFEQILAADSNISDLLVQYVLAPPPPPYMGGDDGMGGGMGGMGGMGMDGGVGLESMQPLSLQVLRILVAGCDRVLSGSGGALVPAERAANLLCLLFTLGSQLAREIATALTTAHISGASAGTGPKLLLPLLLHAAGRAARLAGAGWPLLVSLLRLLAAVVCGCEAAARQMLDDPANLFVVDLATAASESAGVPGAVQEGAALFLGCCFTALPVPEHENGANGAGNGAGNGDSGGAEDGSLLSRRAFLGMVDARIGLSRFSALLKRPLAQGGKGGKGMGTGTSAGAGAGSGAELGAFDSPHFRAFHEARVEEVRAGIFKFYTGAGGGGDSAQQQLVQMQRERIAELEERLERSVGTRVEAGVVSAESADSSSAHTADSSSTHTAAAAAASANEVAELTGQLQQREEQLQSLLEERDGLQSRVEAAAAVQRELAEAAAAAEAERGEMENTVQEVREELQVTGQRADLLEAELAQAREEVEQRGEELRQRGEEVGQREAEVLTLKERAVEEYTQRKAMQEALDQGDRKIELLMGELQLSSDGPREAQKRVGELEARNAQLKQQLWAAEAEVDQMKTQALEAPVPDSEPDTPDAPVFSPADAAVLADAALGLAAALDVTADLEDFEEVRSALESQETPAGEFVRRLEVLLAHCTEMALGAANQCSDIAEGAGLVDLGGQEGSLARVTGCCRKLREELGAAAAREGEAEEECKQMRLRLEEMQAREVEEEGEEGESSGESSPSSAQVAAAVEAVRVEAVDQLEAALAELAEATRAAEEGAASCGAAELRAVVEGERRVAAEVQVAELRLLVEAEALGRAEVVGQLQEAQAAIRAGAEREEGEEGSAIALQGEIATLRGQLEAAEAEVAGAREELLEGEAVMDELRDLLAQAQAQTQAQEVAIETLARGAEAVAVAEAATVEATAAAATAAAAEAAAEATAAVVVADAGLEAEAEAQLRLGAVQQAARDITRQLQTHLDAASFGAAVLRGELGDTLGALASAERFSAQLLASNTTEAVLLSEEKAALVERVGVLEGAVEMQGQLEEAQTSVEQNVQLLKQQQKINQHQQEHQQQLEENLQSEQARHLQAVAACEELDSRCDSLEMELDIARTTAEQLRSALTASHLTEGGDSEAMSSQQREMLRLTNSVDALSKEAIAREQQVGQLSHQLRRREGEAAGVKSTLEDVKADISLLRDENETLAVKLAEQTRQVREAEAEVRRLQQDESAAGERAVADVEAVRGDARAAAVLRGEQGLALLKAQAALKRLLQWLTGAYHISDYRVTKGVAGLVGGMGGADVGEVDVEGAALMVRCLRGSPVEVTDAAALVGAVRSCVQWLLDTQKAELRAQGGVLAGRERELASMKRIILALESSEDSEHAERLLLTPVRGLGPGTGGRGPSSTPGADDSLELSGPEALKFSLDNNAAYPNQHTPAKGNATPAVTPSTPYTASARWSGAKSLLQASPASKQMAKFHSEMLRERSRLQALQEQHSDLLSLLAQQDVELSVFREAVQQGGGELQVTEEKARQQTIDLYGSYTQFRYDL